MIKFDLNPDPDADSDSPLGRSTRRVENYRSRRAKLRLMTIVFSLMFVVVMIGEAFKPENWVWLTGGSLPTAPVEEAIDTRLEATQPLPPGVFVSEPTPDTEDPTAGKSPLGLNLALYRTIKDNTVFRSAEMSAWFDTLAAIRDLPPQEASNLAAERTSFTQLYRQSNQYRGQVVSVAGTVKRANYQRAKSNDSGIEGYYQCWLFPEGSSNPIVVYQLELPDRFPTGDDVNEYAKFDGVFFKRWAYEATGGFMTAPVVLGYDMDWTEKVAEAPTPLPSLQTAVIALCGFALLSAMIAYGVYRSSLRSNKKIEGYRDPDDLAVRSINELADHDIPTEDELVRRELARREGNK